MAQRSHPIVAANCIGIVQHKIQQASKSTSILIDRHMKGDPDAQEVMQLLDALDAKLKDMMSACIVKIKEAA